MENKETTDISTAKSYYRETRSVDTNRWTLEVTLYFAEEYAKLNRDYYLRKQAEVIAEKAKIGGEWKYEGNGAGKGVMGNYNKRWETKVDKQSILQASEEFIKQLK